jgi:hypothetical protein
METDNRSLLSDFDLSLHKRLKPFLEAGLLTHIPNKWQIIQGACQMAPYVLFPDADDGERYKGAPMGHPLLRTPLVLAYVGLDHFHIGSGLRARKKSIIRHLNIVHHQIMPDYDLQLLQLHKDGLAELTRYTKELDNRKAKQSIKRHKRHIDRVLPNAKHYRNELLKVGGFIDRARKMEYTPSSQIPDYLRPEFFSLVRFLEWCNSFPAYTSALLKPWALLRLVGIIFRKR